MKLCRSGEMADAHVSGACGEIREGSSPSFGITFLEPSKFGSIYIIYLGHSDAVFC